MEVKMGKNMLKMKDELGDIDMDKARATIKLGGLLKEEVQKENNDCLINTNTSKVQMENLQDLLGRTVTVVERVVAELQRLQAIVAELEKQGTKEEPKDKETK